MLCTYGYILFTKLLNGCKCYLTYMLKQLPCNIHLSREEFEDTKGAIRNRISKRNRQHNSQKKKDKQRSTKHSYLFYKTKDRVIRTPFKNGVNSVSGAAEG